MPDDLINTLLACMEDGGVGVALFDPGDRLSYANASFLEMFTVGSEEGLTWDGMMRNCHQRKRGLLIDTDDIDTWIKNVQSRRRQVPVRRFESDMVDGRWLWVTETMRPDGWVSVVANDITALKNNEHALRHAHDRAIVAANTDALTGLFNRRFMLSRLEEAIHHWQASGSAFSISLLDLDHFKQINDTYGHLVGDRVLQHFAHQAQSLLRPADVLGRIGGEEFLLFFPDTRLEGASRAVERLRHSLKRSFLTGDIARFRYTFSAGIAQACLGDTQESLLQRADTALYSAKQAGRNGHVALPMNGQ